MTEWKAGDRGQVVEHDDATREPKPGGDVFAATVTAVTGLYAVAKYTDHGWGGGAVTASFYADSGWAAWDGEFRWRLLPPEGTVAAPAAGEGKGNGLGT